MSGNGRGPWSTGDDAARHENPLEQFERIVKRHVASKAPVVDAAKRDEALMDFFVRYRAMREKGSPFVVGDFVTPRPDGTLMDAGKKHIVVDVRKVDEPQFFGRPAANDFGRFADIRVACTQHGTHVVTFWCESVEYEKWTEEHKFEEQEQEQENP